MITNTSQDRDPFVYLSGTVKCASSNWRGTLRPPWDKGPAEEQQCQLLPAFAIRCVLLSLRLGK